MIEHWGRFLLWLICGYLLVAYYENYEIPRRLQAARMRMIYQCEEMTGKGCADLIPVMIKCSE